MSQTLDEILDSIGDLFGAYSLQNGQKGFESDATISLLVLDQPFDLAFGGVLTQSAQDFADFVRL